MMDVPHRHMQRGRGRRSVSAHRDTTSAIERISHVLIVDDDEVMRTTLHWPLADAGYEVLEAPDGLAALNILAKSAVPLVVLLDLMMPHMSGYELLRLLSARPDWSGRHAFIVVTAATGPFGPAFVQPLVAQLAITVVPKPFDLDDLLGAVDAAADRMGTAATAEAASEVRQAQTHPHPLP